VVVDHGGEPRVGAEALVLLFGRQRHEVGADGGDPVAVALLPPDDGTVELALGKPLRSFDAGAPCQLVEPAEAVERREPRVAAEAARERAAGPDAGWVEMEGAEEAVDVVGDAGLGRARIVVGRDQPGAHGADDRVLLVAEEDRHGWGSLPTVNLGSRFSRKAAMPSARSALVVAS